MRGQRTVRTTRTALVPDPEDNKIVSIMGTSRCAQRRAQGAGAVLGTLTCVLA